MRRISVAATLAVTAVLALAACGDEPASRSSDSGATNYSTSSSTDSGPTSPSTSSGTGQTTPSADPADPRTETVAAGAPSADELYPAGQPVPKRTAQGANAAPGGSSASFIDFSQKAADSFWWWYTYESQTQQSLQRSPQKVYEDGVIACTWSARGSGTPAVMETLKANMGYNGDGAAAVTRAALMALCPRYNRGFLTAFDQNVDKAIQAIWPKVTFPNQPEFYRFGHLMKMVCGYFNETNTVDGLYPWLMQYKADVPLVDTQDVRAVKIMVVEVTMAGCSSYYTRFGPWWTMG